MKFRSEILFTLLLLVFFAFFVWEARDWRPQARLYPWTIGFTMLLFVLVELAGQLRGKRSEKVSEDAPVDFQFTQGVDASVARWRTLNIFSWIFGFFLGVWLVGFQVGIPLLVFAYLKFQSRETWLLSLSLTAAAALFFWGLFDRLLHLPFPEGQLFLWWGS